MTKTELADRISKERSTVYDIFDRKSVDLELLIELSKALDYDFIRNIYYKEQTDHSICISFKTEEDLLKKLNLFEDFIHFIKGKT